MVSRAETTRETEGSVRHADAADLPLLERMLVRAYMDDPVAMWICGSARLRRRLLEGLYSARLRQMLRHRVVWTNTERSSVAVWVAPQMNQPRIPASAALLGCLMDPRLLARLPLLAVGFNSMQHEHARRPAHWYLSLLATDPDAQGHGFGSAVLQPVLEQCDSDGVGAYLESSKPRNVGFYERHGFRVAGELRLPSGPVMWPMWREPSELRV